MKEIVAARIRAARENAGLSQLELAERAGTTQPAVSQWESGRSLPLLTSAIRLADAFGVSVDWLIGRES